MRSVRSRGRLHAHDHARPGRNKVLEGIGFIPRGPETQIYSVEGSDLSLVATAEITLGGMLAEQVLEADALPLKFCGISHCFRTEAGAARPRQRGLFRVHQFTKVEMFAFTLPDQSEPMLEQIRGIECRIFDGLGIPYRVIDTPSGDLGGPAYRKYDLEAWMPGRGEIRRVTSTSNCTDYQARRLRIRYRIQGERAPISSTRSTARPSPSAARWSRSWKTTNRPTDRWSSRKCSGPWWEKSGSR